MINLQRLNLPVGNTNLNTVPTCDNKLVQYLKAPAVLVNDLYYTLVDKLRGTTSGSESGRDGVVGAYFDGNGIRYVDLENVQNLGTSHTIKFQAALNVATEIIIGSSANNESFIASLVSGTIRYSVVGGSADFTSYTIDTEMREYEIIRTGTSMWLYVDGNLESTATLSLDVDFVTDRLFNWGASLVFGGQASYIDLNGLLFNFQEGNNNNVVQGIREDGNFVNGFIQNATGDDRVSTTALDSDMNENGYLKSDGVTYYYDVGLAQPIPDGVLLYTRNGLATAYTSEGQATPDFSGALKANVRVVDGEYITKVSDGSEWSLTDAVMQSDRIRMTVNGITERSLLSIELPPSTKKAIVVRIYDTDITGELFIFSAQSDLISNVNFGNATGDINRELETDASVTSNQLYFYVNGGIDGEFIEFDVLGVYDEQYINDTLPTSGQPVNGNSLIQETTKKSVVDADLLTTIQMFNHDDPDAVYPVVVAVADILRDDNPRFTDKGDNNDQIKTQIVYSEVLVDPCKTKAQDFTNTHEAFMVDDEAGGYEPFIVAGQPFNVYRGDD